MGACGLPGPRHSIRSSLVTLPSPPRPSAVSVTSNLPGSMKVCRGLTSVENEPTPKSHRRALTLPVERSVKATVSGALPEVPLVPKSALGFRKGSSSPPGAGVGRIGIAAGARGGQASTFEAWNGKNWNGSVLEPAGRFIAGSRPDQGNGSSGWGLDSQAPSHPTGESLRSRFQGTPSNEKGVCSAARLISTNSGKPTPTGVR